MAIDLAGDRFMHLGRLMLAMLAIAVAGQAHAATYLWKGEGQITGISGILDGVAVPAPSGSIKVGDPWQFAMTFSTDKAELSTTFDANPLINLYWLTDYSLVGYAGGLQFSSGPGWGASIQLWDGYTGSDAQALLANRPKINEMPFDIGPDGYLQTIHWLAVDYSQMARNNDSIDDIKPLEAFNQQWVSFWFFSMETKMLVIVNGEYVGTLAAVPEPSSWIAMLIGVGAIGVTLRRRRNYSALNPASCAAPSIR